MRKGGGGRGKRVPLLTRTIVEGGGVEVCDVRVAKKKGR
jgi:hypothetical protein